MTRRDAGDPHRLPPVIEATIRAVLDAAELDLTDGREEVERELRHHFEDGLGSGASAEELVRRFGDPEQAGRRIAQTRPRAAARGRGEIPGPWGSLDAWRGEMARAVRRLARSPGFSFVVVATLALGVGANTGIFTVLDAVLLEDLPYPEPDRLVRVFERSREDGTDFEYLRAPVVAEYRTWDEIFEEVASLYTYRETGADLTDGDRPVRVNLLRVSAGYFETLGIAPARGRVFLEEESTGPGEAATTRDLQARVVVVSHDLWRDHFGGDEDILGRTIRLDDESYEVVGVMPARMRDPFGAQAQLWMPQDLRPGGSNSFGNFYLSAVARLRSGITLEQARERGAALQEQWAAVEPEVADWTLELIPLHDDIVGDTRARMIWILAAAGILVLLTACLNVANLLVARGLRLDRPLALQSALGTGRSRLMASILAENGLLATAGGLAGLGVAWMSLEGLTLVAPAALPGIADVSMGPRAFVFALLVTVAALLLFGLAPALRLSRTAPADVLRAGDRSSTARRGSKRLRDGLVVAQVAVALVLVTGAALLSRSFSALTEVPLGIDSDGVLTFEVHLPDARYPEGEARHAFHRRFHERLRSLPQVESVGAISWLPVRGRYHTWGIQRPSEAESPDDPGSWRSSDVRVIAGDYFEALGIELVRGRAPREVDPAGEDVVWINETLAADVFGEVEPLEERISVNGDPRRIVGIVEDVPHDTRGETSRKLYLMHAQYHSNRNWAMTQVVRARPGTADALDPIRRVVSSLDGQLVVHRPRALGDILSDERAQDRFATSLMAAFAFLALALAVLGTYGLLSGSVSARTREIGIRMALGADGGSIRHMVLRYAAVITATGVVLGLAGAWLASGVLEVLLFGVEATSPWAYAPSVLLFLWVGVAAAWVPARRATRVDTVRVLTAD